MIVGCKNCRYQNKKGQCYFMNSFHVKTSITK